jgi:hypothetical protein
VTNIPGDFQFFLLPRNALQRQCEALRAYFVERVSSGQVGKRFGYTPGSFRVLCHTFRHDPQFRDRFFSNLARAPSKAERVRDLVVALGKKNHSVYDIQRELAADEISISVDSLSVLLKEEGFERLPRRLDEERPDLLRPEMAATADVRELSLSPRTMETRCAGLFLFVPLMRSIELGKLVGDVALPGSKMIPAEQALRSLLALKLVGKERKSHVMDLVFDEGIALFSGLNVVPKRSYLAAYSSRVDARHNARLMRTWFEAVRRAGLKTGSTFHLDFHTIAFHGGDEFVERHYVSRRSRRQKGILAFFAQDVDHRVFCYANADLRVSEQRDEILRFVEYWKKHTGRYPEELVFDSQLTTYENLSKLNELGIRFLTLRRRSKKMLDRLGAIPPTAWKRVTLRSLTRQYRTPRVLDESIQLKEYRGTLRQLSVVDLGHEEPTIVVTNHLTLTPATLITRYAQRMLIENGLADAVDFFHVDALSSAVGLKVDFDLQITLMASCLYRMMGERIGRGYERAHARQIFRKLLDVPGEIQIGGKDIVVSLAKHAHNPLLAASGLADKPTVMPWLDGRRLIIHIG